mgnify:CR=1 FL=1
MLLQNNTTNNTTYKPIPAGMHLARCFMYADIGTQESNYGDKRQILVYFEVHGEDPNTGDPLLTDKGEPMTIFKKYTLSWNEKAILRKDLESWRGGAFSPEEQKRFDLKNILGKWCMLNISNNPDKNNPDKIWDNIQSITPVPQQIKKVGLPEPVNENRHFELDNFSHEEFETLPNFAKNRIQKSAEWVRISGKVDKPYNDMNDNIPF